MPPLQAVDETNGSGLSAHAEKVFRTERLYLAQTIPGVPNDIGQWAPWLVMAAILLLYISQNGGNISALIKVVGKVQDANTDTEKKVQENTVAINSLEATNKDVVLTNKAVVQAIDGLKAVTTQGSDEMRRAFKDGIQHYVETTKDLSDVSNQNAEKVFKRLEAVELDLKAIPQATLDGIGPLHDDLEQRIIKAFTSAAKDVFDGCIEENKRLVEENEVLKRKVASVTQSGVLPIVVDERPNLPTPDSELATVDAAKEPAK